MMANQIRFAATDAAGPNLRQFESSGEVADPLSEAEYVKMRHRESRPGGQRMFRDCRRIPSPGRSRKAGQPGSEGGDVGGRGLGVDQVLAGIQSCYNRRRRVILQDSIIARRRRLDLIGEGR